MVASIASHREALRRRGLSDAEIDRRGYRTLARHGRARAARDLREQLGDAVLLSVPGFIVRQGNGGADLTIAGAAGLLVPVRDAAGRIAALLHLYLTACGSGLRAGELARPGAGVV